MALVVQLLEVELAEGMEAEAECRLVGAGLLGHHRRQSHPTRLVQHCIQG